MSTATFNEPAPAAETPHDRTLHAAMLRRFLWKETRMLSGLWLAILAMGVFVEWVVNAFTPPVLGQAMMLFCVALCATVLYALGAAATIFSVEHEEETYNFLAGLPAKWWPVFSGKLVVVFTSAGALAASLSVIGWMICGFDTPSGKDMTDALALFGVAVLEGMAWGTLFSLLMKRPLVAAMLTIVVGAVMVNVIVNTSSSYAVASLNPDAYQEAVPVRLAVSAIVLLASAVAARGWLVSDRGARGVQLGRLSPRKRRRSQVAARFCPASIPTNTPSRRMMLARLIWQTWRDSWKLLLVPLGVGSIALLCVTAAIGLFTMSDEPIVASLVCSMFFVPALYGALAFSSDQRRESYRFLSEHAGRPRYVWLARHIVWFGTLVVVFLAFYLLAAGLFLLALRYSGANFAEAFVQWGTPAPEMGYDFIQFTRFVVQGTTLAAFGVLTAYSLGQLCSMLVRSEILAAFLALLLSVSLSAWIAILFVWQLSGWLFLVPLAIGAMLATWLRAPDWIAGRNTWRSWVKPGLAIVAAVSLVAVALPTFRLQQIRNRPVLTTGFQPWQVSTAAFVSDRSALDSPESRETADMYRKAVELLHSWKRNELLDRWAKPEFMGDGSAVVDVGGIAETKIPPDQLADYRAAIKAQEKSIRGAQAAAVKLAIEASARPFCYFDFDVSQPSWPSGDRSYYEFIELLDALSSIELTEPFDRLLAALQMSVHLSAGQPSVVWLDQIEREQKILQKVGQWAAYEGRTREELEFALAQLSEHFRVWQTPSESMYADHRLVRDVILGRRSPWAVNRESDLFAVQLAIMANELPWERERALAALEVITRQNTGDAEELLSYLSGVYARQYTSVQLRKWLRPRWAWARQWPANWKLASPAAATSYLTRYEYEARSRVHELYAALCDIETCRRAAQLQLALAMYRLDQDEYPAWLSELVPEYLKAMPLDPYLGQPFQYEPDGLDLPLLMSSSQPTSEGLAPSTPLLWSVGPGSARLTRWERRQLPEGAQDWVTDLVYILATEDNGFWGEPTLVFPLAD
jgi:hypothetical protein